MAKKRKVLGSVLKGKDGKGSYIKIRGEQKLVDGQTLSLESKKSRLESLESATADGKVSEELAEKIKASIEKTPEFVLFEIVAYE